MQEQPMRLKVGDPCTTIVDPTVIHVGSKFRTTVFQQSLQVEVCSFDEYFDLELVFATCRVVIAN